MVRTIAKDYDEKRRHILSVAAQVFSRHGVARASMSEVASTCGISKALIYHYYASKDDIIFDILDRYLESLRDRVCGLELSDLSPPEQLRLITRELLLAYEGMDHEHKIQTEGIHLLSSEKQRQLRNYQRQLVDCMSDILVRCSPKKLSTSGKYRREVTMSVFGMLNWFYMWNAHATRQERIDYAATVSELTLNGIS